MATGTLMVSVSLSAGKSTVVSFTTTPAPLTSRTRTCTTSTPICVSAANARVALGEKLGANPSRPARECPAPGPVGASVHDSVVRATASRLVARRERRIILAERAGAETYGARPLQGGCYKIGHFPPPVD